MISLSYRRLHLLLLPMSFVCGQTSIGGGFVSNIIASDVPSSSPVVYEIVFENTWSAITHPPDYPGSSSPHWSPPVVAAHSSDYTMWETRGTATSGVKVLAEASKMHILFKFSFVFSLISLQTGAFCPLNNEVIGADNAVGDVEIGSSQFNEVTQTQNLAITPTPDHP
jgi:Spondin_N